MEDFMIEFVGLIGSALILVSLLFKTHTYKGALILRILNAIGSGIFVIYGVAIMAYSTIFLNVSACIINIYFILRMKKDYEHSN